MTDPTVTDLRRELQKAEDALSACLLYLSRHAQGNAALHCSERVMYSPLHAKVEATITGVVHALKRTEMSPDEDGHYPDCAKFVEILADLDRCMHGRHEDDACGDCGGISGGNHLLPDDRIIGYGLYGDLIVMPDRDHKHDPAAWRARPDAAGDRA